MLLDGLKIGFALTGSFCTIDKVIPEIKKIVDNGGKVTPIISHSVDKFDTRFGKAEDFKKQLKDITGEEIVKTVVDAEPIGPKSLLDIIVVAPCTGNTLGKIVNGITDTSVTMACKAQLRNQKPVLIAVSTNDALGTNAKNIGLLLNMRNVFLVPFGQDGPKNKSNSMVAKISSIMPALLEAVNGKQIQPVFIQY
ncbi:dipicolinate synthase subunit B [Herbivorax sp. ANBcel31]|uniref:dipicolinate synthase subunit B n=1 Tax=Herbivorax sp. ANBcel31 TaxID=3069754 RepID=UPI0027ADE0B5|nr:dipicolinate synthase subunit B [Herbivorax sp. ANBcel31]MDQ2085846.1 dipicolinate synthase subunit B [Herbivorax sp. ANBcel31]